MSLFQQHFDGLLVNSDPDVLRLEETFSLAPEIEDRTVYTGFVTAGPAPVRLRSKRRILISIGGGSFANELPEAMIGVAGRLARYEFAFIPGPFTPTPLLARLRRERRPQGNIRVLRFQGDFQEALSRCRLSVSLGGYNTVMDLLNTRTPALVYPYRADREQLTRAPLREGWALGLSSARKTCASTV